MNHDIYDITNNGDSYNVPVSFQSTILKATFSEHAHWLQVYIQNINLHAPLKMYGYESHYKIYIRAGR